MNIVEQPAKMIPTRSKYGRETSTKTIPANQEKTKMCLDFLNKKC